MKEKKEKKEITEEFKKEIINKWSKINLLNNESSDDTFKSEFDDNLLPMAKKLAAQTIGLDLVSVVPMSSPSTSFEKDSKLLDKAKTILDVTNRQIALDNFLNNENKEKLKIEDIKEYEDYIKSGSGLIYANYIPIITDTIVEGNFTPTKMLSSRYKISGEK